jgi:hypothetical protein
VISELRVGSTLAKRKMCVQEENRIEGLCSCLCTDIDDSERELIATWVRHFQKGTVDSCAVFAEREIFELCEFFARSVYI